MNLKRLILISTTLFLLAAASNVAQNAPAPRQNVVAPAPSIDPLDPALLNQYCITCHNQRAKTAGLMLDTLDYQHLDKDTATWEKVIRKVKTGMMPPSGARRPDRGQF